jgi:hypothetical protein
VELKRKRSALITASLFLVAGIYGLARGFLFAQSDLFFAGITACGMAVEELSRGKYLEW